MRHFKVLINSTIGNPPEGKLNISLSLPQELERGMEVMGKNHSQEVRMLRQKNKLLSLETEGLRNASQRMQTHLKVNTIIYIYIYIYIHSIMFIRISCGFKSVSCSSYQLVCINLNQL